MNKIISVLRILVLLTLCTAAIIGIFGDADGELQWWSAKLTGIAAAVIAARLYIHWAKDDRWLRSYARICDEIIDAPNPTQL